MKIRKCSTAQMGTLRHLDNENTREQLHAYIVELRDTGVTLQAVADVLGCTRQFVNKMEIKGRKAAEKKK